MTDTTSHNVDETARAYDLLGEGRLDEVLRILAPSQHQQSPVQAAIALTATGMLMEQRSEFAAADEQFRAALDCGIPLPLILREAGRYFASRNQFETASLCLSMLANTFPNVAKKLFDEFPASAKTRFLPWFVCQFPERRVADLYRLRLAKEALVQRLGEHDATFVLSMVLRQKDGWKTERLPLISLHAFAQRHGTAYIELYPPRTISLPPVATGGPDRRRSAVTISTRSVFFCALPDVLVSGRSALVLTDGSAILDYQGDERERLPVTFTLEPRVMARDGEAVIARKQKARDEVEVIDEAFHLNGIHTPMFGHWMMEFLPKFWACMELEEMRSVPILVDGGMPRQHMEALELFSGGAHKLIKVRQNQTVRVRRLLTCSTFAYWPVGSVPGHNQLSKWFVFDPKAMAAVVQKALRRIGAAKPGAGAKRIYLARKDTQHKQLTNFRAVEERVMRRGFRIHYFQDLSFREQIDLIQGAEVVVGPEGSAFFMCALARPGLRIGMLNNQAVAGFEPCFEWLRQLGHEPRMLLGEASGEPAVYDIHQSYMIDLDQLDQFLDGLLDELRDAPDEQSRACTE